MERNTINMKQTVLDMNIKFDEEGVWTLLATSCEDNSDNSMEIIIISRVILDQYETKGGRLKAIGKNEYVSSDGFRL
jgi:hypothetical protein